MIVIFTAYIFSRIFKKRELSENIYNAKISTFTVYNFQVFSFYLHHLVMSLMYSSLNNPTQQYFMLLTSGG